MAIQEDDLPKTTVVRDLIDSFDLEETESAYFDSSLNAWVLSRHADVHAAFHCASLIPGRRDLADVRWESEQDTRLKMREEVRGALSQSQVRAWCERLEFDAKVLCQELPLVEPVDLIAAYARPLCLIFAAMVTGAAKDEAHKLAELAKIVSAATADSENPLLRADAKQANETLCRHFRSGPEPLRDSGFVGLSQTLVGIVGAGWYALVRFPDQWSLLRSPQFVDQAVEEFLRYGSVVRTLTRTATEDVGLNGLLIRKGDRILLRVFEANHDPARFEEPNKLDCTRRDAGHFALGAGGHACVAANMIRMATVALTRPLLARFDSVELLRPVECQGGSTMRSPVSLWVTLRHR